MANGKKDKNNNMKVVVRVKPANGKKDKNNNMKVVVRVRPANNMEINKQSSTSVRVMDERILVFDPNDDSVDYLSGDRSRKQPHFLTRRARDLRFMFDRVFDSESSNRDIFEHTTKTIVEGVLGGYNCTAFAYGATGAGKTFTMLGDQSNPGVMFLTMMELYSRINACKDEKISDVAVSYLEVYNETIRDLLTPGQPLAVREDPQRGVCVSGLSLHKPTSAEELLGMLEFGNNNRTQHPTDANAQSSRSHAVFQVFVRQKDRTAGLQANFTMGKMSLIDLAGSERAIVTSNRGARFREGANINKSLLALGNCINALADKENKTGHIPYRDSKLTRILKDSLGGNCRTVMIAAVSPSGLSYEDTYNTLKYADRAMNIKCKVIKNELSVDMHVSCYAKIVQDLRKEISELKSKLFGCELGSTMPKKSDGSHAQMEEIERLSTSLRSVMKERMVVRRNIIDIEAAERDLQVKLYRKERSLKRMQFVCVNGEKLDQSQSKTQLCTSNTKSKQKYLTSKKTDFEEQIAKNNKWMERIQSEVKLLEADVEATARLDQCQAIVQLQLENMELRRNCQLYKRHVHAQEKDAQNTERLVEKLLGMVQKQFFLLKGVGLATQELTEEYDNIIETVDNGREVTWADQSANDHTVSDKSSFTSFQVTSILGTPLMRTPIRKRQFNTPNDMTPYLSATHTKQQNRTFTYSATTEIPEFANPCISLTKEFEAMSSPAKVSRSLEHNEQQVSVTSKEINSVQQNKTIAATPLRVSSHKPFKASDSRLLSPAIFQRQNGVNDQSKSVPRKATPHPKVCWTDTPVKVELSPPQKTKNPLRNATPMRESIDFNLSGIQLLQDSPTDKEQQKISSEQVRPPPSRDALSTPLRELSVNKQHVVKDQLPSVLSQSKLFSKDKSNSHKKGKDMMPKRVNCSATKENVQSVVVPSRSASVLGLDKLHSKKVKKHVNGLRRAMSSNSIATSRNFAPRTSPKRGNSAHSRSLIERPRWQ